MSYNWDEEAVLHLIQKYRENDILWNPKNPDYKNRSKRMDVVNNIATLFGTNISEIERKLKNLTCHYFREKKLEEMRNWGDSKCNAEDVREPKWFAFKALDFLRDKVRPLETINSENISVTNAESSTRKRRSKYSPDSDSEIADVLKVIKEISASLAARDDASVFGEYIASKIRKMDPVTTSKVQHHIINIIYQAEIGADSYVPQGHFTASTPGNASPSTSQQFETYHLVKTEHDTESNSSYGDGIYVKQEKI